MNREEIIQILSEYAVDLFAHGLRYGYETNTPLLEKIADEIVSLPPAEGAEAILHRHIDKQSMDELSVNVWPDMLEAMTEFATLHAQRIAEKMVEERLREALTDWADYWNELETGHACIMKEDIDEYLKTRDSHE